MRTREQPPRTALVLHHDRWVRAHLADELRMAGYGVLAASNGFSGLRLAEQHQPGLILLSPALPELSGGEVLDHLRAGSSTRDTPALIVDDTQGARGAGPAVLPQPTGVGLLAYMEQALVHGGRTGRSAMSRARQQPRSSHQASRRPGAPKPVRPLPALLERVVARLSRRRAALLTQD